MGQDIVERLLQLRADGQPINPDGRMAADEIEWLRGAVPIVPKGCVLVCLQEGEIERLNAQVKVLQDLNTANFKAVTKAWDVIAENRRLRAEISDNESAMRVWRGRCTRAEAEVETLKAANVRLQEALAADPLDQSMANEKLLEQVAEARAEVAALQAKNEVLRDMLREAAPYLPRGGGRLATGLPSRIDAALAAGEQKNDAA